MKPNMVRSAPLQAVTFFLLHEHELAVMPEPLLVISALKYESPAALLIGYAYFQ
jgi:hypothetical protein